jgi:hypothetical protein
MPHERVELLRLWHEASDASLRAALPADITFMGLRLRIPEDVFPVDESGEGDAYHQAVAEADVQMEAPDSHFRWKTVTVGSEPRHKRMTSRRRLIG